MTVFCPDNRELTGKGVIVSNTIRILFNSTINSINYYKRLVRLKLKYMKKQINKYISSFFDKNNVVEMLYDEDEGETSFAIFRGGKIEYKNSIEINGINFKPLPSNDDLVKHKVILFPSKSSKYKGEEELIREIKDFIHTYLQIGPVYENIASYYVLFSWAYDRFSELPYLRALGDYGSGKTRFLQTIGSLCYKPIFAGGATTVSPIFRIISEHNGTLIMDEADFLYSDSTSEMIKILNNGFAKGFPVLRTEGKGSYEVKAYKVFSPKIIATRGKYKDKALESRFLVEEMDKRNLRDDIPLSLGDTFWNRALGIRNKLLSWRFENINKKIDLNVELDRTLEPRLNQIITPILSVMNCEETKKELRKFIKIYNDEIISERGTEYGADVMIAILKIDKSGVVEPTIKQITDIYNQLLEEKEKITSKKMGWMIRDILKIKTFKKRGGYVIDCIKNKEKLKNLKEKYGINDEDLRDGLGSGDVNIVNDVNFVQHQDGEDVVADIEGPF